MLTQLSAKLNDSGTLITIFALSCLASLLRTEQHTFKSILTGIIFAGFVAYAANLGLTGIESIDDNQRAVFVGCLTYLNRYVLELLNKFGENVSNDPKKALGDLKGLWSNKK